MHGLVLHHNGEIISAAMDQKNVSIFITKINNDITLNFSGTNFQKSQGMTWYNSKLHRGERIIIEVRDINKESNPIEEHPLSRENTHLEKKNRNDLEYDLARFEQLKKILENRGLI